jgi:hypothetical protein
LTITVVPVKLVNLHQAVVAESVPGNSKMLTLVLAAAFLQHHTTNQQKSHDRLATGE